MARKKILIVFGTRPEAIKMAPVVQACQAHDNIFDTIVCVTGQHREMLDQVLALFALVPDIDLNVMQGNQDLWSLTATVLLRMGEVIAHHKPDIVLVHGDTTTTMATALAAFYARVPIGHVEAGLRTYNMHHPFPEEANRIITDALAQLYFAPTEQAALHLRDSNACGSVHVTGNTVIDALLHVAKNTQFFPQAVGLDPAKKTLLLTLHRRENFGAGFQDVCTAIRTLVSRYPGIQVICPLHKNPNVRATIQAELEQRERIVLIEPLEYSSFIGLMQHAYIILTDSGGIQEEAPSLGKPVLVLRETTERPEAITAGTAKLVGTNVQRIVDTVSILLDQPTEYAKMATASNPFGDGKAAEKIVEILKGYLNAS